MSAKLKKQAAPVAPRRRSHREALLTYTLIALIPSALCAFPLTAALSFVPFVGFIALPSLLGLIVFLLYGIAWLVSLILAQDESPASYNNPIQHRLWLPWSPTRCFAIDRAVFRWVVEIFKLGIVPELLADWAYRRVMMLGGHSASIVREGISYGSKPTNLLDVYLPPSSATVNGQAPVVVFVPGGGKVFAKRQYYAQLALRLRKLGYAVVIPDITQFPAGRSRDQVADLRAVLEWTARQASTFNADPEQIYLFGHGAGAHLSLLTVVQEAVVRSRDEHLLRAYEQDPEMDDSAIDVAAGIKRLEIWGEHFVMPELKGLILMAPIVDVIKHCRAEARLGIEHLSPLRRTLGPSHSHCLMASPSHLLYGSKQILDPERLPEKTLIIHGGQDTSVAIAHSVLLKTLWTGLGASVRLRAYRELSHLEGLTSLARSGPGAKRSRYAGLITAELVQFIASDD